MACLFAPGFELYLSVSSSSTEADTVAPRACNGATCVPQLPQKTVSLSIVLLHRGHFIVSFSFLRFLWLYHMQYVGKCLHDGVKNDDEQGKAGQGNVNVTPGANDETGALLLREKPNRLRRISAGEVFF